MSCSSLSLLSQKIGCNNCFQQPLTKAALFVISLLFAGGAVVSHFAGAGIPGIVAFSILSGGFMTIFIIACSCGSSSIKSKPTPRSHTPTIEERNIVKEKQLQEAAKKERGERISRMSNKELLQKFIPSVISIHPKAIAGANSQEAPLSEENELIKDALGKRISNAFKTEAKNNEEVITNGLRPIFSEALSAPDKFDNLAAAAVLMSPYIPRFTAAIFEKLEWPSEEFKKEVLPKYLGMKIVNPEYCCISYQDDFINFGSTESSDGFCTNRVVLITKNIFGTGDFTNQPKLIPESVAQTIGFSIRLIGELLIKDLKEHKETGTINRDTNIGMRVVIGQYMECRFPASVLSPLLPYLTNVPGLVGLELSDVGVRTPHDDITVAKTGHGFGDEDAEALLDIFRTNPHLTQVQINVDNMSPAKLKEFLEAWQNIWTDRQFTPPQIEQILALPSTKNT